MIIISGGEYERDALTVCLYCLCNGRSMLHRPRVLLVAKKRNSLRHLWQQMVDPTSAIVHQWKIVYRCYTFGNKEYGHLGERISKVAVFLVTQHTQ